MAVVAQVMEQGNYRDLDDGTMPRFPYTLIHSDIKPLNSRCLLISDLSELET